MLIGWVQLMCLLLPNHFVGKSGSGLWLALLESQAPPQKGERGSFTVLRDFHHTPSRILATVLEQDL